MASLQVLALSAIALPWITLPDLVIGSADLATDVGLASQLHPKNHKLAKAALGIGISSAVINIGVMTAIGFSTGFIGDSSTTSTILMSEDIIIENDLSLYEIRQGEYIGKGHYGAVYKVNDRAYKISNTLNSDHSKAETIRSAKLINDYWRSRNIDIPPARALIIENTYVLESKFIPGRPLAYVNIIDRFYIDQAFSQYKKLTGRSIADITKIGNVILSNEYGPVVIDFDNAFAMNFPRKMSFASENYYNALHSCGDEFFPFKYRMARRYLMSGFSRNHKLVVSLF